MPGVFQLRLKLKSMYLRVVWFGFHWTPAEYSSLDGLYLHCLRECCRSDAAFDGDTPPPLAEDVDDEAPGSAAPWRTAAVTRDWQQELDHVKRLKPADPNSEKADFEQGCIGGLRRTHTALAQLPEVTRSGQLVRKALDKLFSEKPEIE